MNPRDRKPKDNLQKVTVGTFKEKTEVLPNGMLKETRRETTVTIRREEPLPSDERV